MPTTRGSFLVMSNPQPTSPLRASSAHVLDVDSMNCERLSLEVWDGLQRDEMGRDVRVARVQLTVDQARALAARLTATADEVLRREVWAERILTKTAREALGRALEAQS